MERVLGDAADELRREEVGELRGEGRGDGVEVGALVFFDAARRADLSEVSVSRFSGIWPGRGPGEREGSGRPRDVIARA